MMTYPKLRFLWLVLWLICGCLVISAGCRPEREGVVIDEQGPPAVRATLRMTVIGESRLGEQIQDLWELNTGGDLEVQTLPLEVFVRDGIASLPPTDIMIYPSRLKADLAAADALHPLESFFLDDVDFDRSDLLSSQRGDLVKWGPTTVALSLGEPNWALLINRRVLDQVGLESPATWEALQAWLRQLDERDWSDAAGGAFESLLDLPGGDHWYARQLGMWAASYHFTRGRFSTYFDLRTMEPLIDSPPFERALEELVATAEYANFVSPDRAYERLVRGQTAAAITWPSAGWNRHRDTEIVAEPVPVAVRPLPQATFRFDYSRSIWIEREDDRPVVVDGLAGWLVSVHSGSAYVRQAQELVIWLAGPEMTASLAGIDPHVGLSRSSHLASPAGWIGDDLAMDSRREYTEVIDEQGQSAARVQWLPVIEADRYAAVLDEAIARCLAGEIEVEAALAQVKAEWDQLTESIGRERQREAYRRGLGLD